MINCSSFTHQTYNINNTVVNNEVSGLKKRDDNDI